MEKRKKKEEKEQAMKREERRRVRAGSRIRKEKTKQGKERSTPRSSGVPG